jgi:hypothetical protein
MLENIDRKYSFVTFSVKKYISGLKIKYILLSIGVLSNILFFVFEGLNIT